MLLEKLREDVMKANQQLVREGVVKFTFGNVSGIAREEGLVAIKPSGVPYEELTPRDDRGHRPRRPRGRQQSEALVRPADASGTLQGVPQYRRRRPHPFGIRHLLGAGAAADPLPRHHPCRLLPRAGAGDRRHDGGRDRRGIREGDGHGDRAQVPRSRPRSGRRFRWCWSPATAPSPGARMPTTRCTTLRALEYIARMATHSFAINPEAQAISQVLHDKHFLRKHGAGAYYGQSKG